MKIVLASASLRRQELLKRIIDNFEIIVSEFHENDINFTGDCANYVMEISKGKALDVARKVGNDKIIIGCDTVVFYNNKVLGKPKDEKDAYRMLEMLSGNSHYVYSGITLVDTSRKIIRTDYVKTEVEFCDFGDNEIRKYLKTGEPFDKAGAYGIQGYGGVFVKKINGCYYNVVGLPLNKLYSMLREIGVNH